VRKLSKEDARRRRRVATTLSAIGDPALMAQNQIFSQIAPLKQTPAVCPRRRQM